MSHMSTQPHASSTVTARPHWPQTHLSPFFMPLPFFSDFCFFFPNIIAHHPLSFSISATASPNGLYSYSLAPVFTPKTCVYPVLSVLSGYWKPCGQPNKESP